VFVVVCVWVAFTGASVAGKLASRNVSDVGLAVAAFAACAACVSNARHRLLRHRRVWLFLVLSAVSWGVGQLFWTYY